MHILSTEHTFKHLGTRREDREGYQKVRSAMWGDTKPASTFLLVSGLARPEFLVEVEVIAAKSD